MIVVDGSGLTIALPPIRRDLGFSDASLIWIVNAYVLPYSGFLLLSGRLGDFFGHRRLFLYGVALFTAASLACATASSQWQLVSGRILQGLSGAVVATVAQALIMEMFSESTERAKAIGIYGFACSGGSVFGLMLGGVLISAVSWRWMFLINLPIGAAVFALGGRLLPAHDGAMPKGRLDYAGATTVTAALILAVYAVLDGNVSGGSSLWTLVMLGGAAFLLILFVWIEARSPVPLMPLGVFKNRNLAICCIIKALFSTALSTMVFQSLYLQLVLQYSPWEVGLAFVPGNLVLAVIAIRVSAKVVIRFGTKLPLAFGLLSAATGLLLLGRAPVPGTLTVDVLPGMLLMAVGIAISFNPVLLAAMQGTAPDQCGLVSGVMNTCSTMGGALGLAVLASASAARTNARLESGEVLAVALNDGYHVAFVAAAVCTLIAAIFAVTLLKTSERLPRRPRISRAPEYSD
jgi:EmrB/QacA subfamily drug resistance transporter